MGCPFLGWLVGFWLRWWGFLSWFLVLVHCRVWFLRSLVCGGFWFVAFRPGLSSVVSTHSTGRFGVGQGQRVLAGGGSGWTVDGGFLSR